MGMIGNMKLRQAQQDRIREILAHQGRAAQNATVETRFDPVFQVYRPTNVN